jgi:glycerate-2-kinase
MAAELGRRDLLIVLLSGGASSLLPAPVAGITLRDKQRTTQELLRCGASIREINTVRKHLSRIKGGRLAELTEATVVTLILSDVLGDDLSAIASGPTVLSRCRRDFETLSHLAGSPSKSASASRPWMSETRE